MPSNALESLIQPQQKEHFIPPDPGAEQEQRHSLCPIGPASPASGAVPPRKAALHTIPCSQIPPKSRLNPELKMNLYS